MSLSFEHVDLLANRIPCLQALRQELTHALLTLFDLILGQHESRKRAHSQILGKSPIFREIFVDVVRQFPGEDEERALTLSHLLEQIHELLISSNICVDRDRLAPLFDPILEATDTLEPSTCLVGVRESQHSCQFCISIVRQFVALAQPLRKLDRVVIICASPILASGFDHFRPPPRVDVKVIQTAGNPLWMAIARPHG